MAQRDSGYQRKARDAYMTPAWVTNLLIDDLEREGILPLRTFVKDKGFTPAAIWEPAAGDGQMSGALAVRGYDVFATDIHPHELSFEHDFLGGPAPSVLPGKIGAIITNPPYKVAEDFVATALEMMAPVSGVVAMLLKVDFDSAGGRESLFGGCSAYRRKIVLTDRITWFYQLNEQGRFISPSENHAWFVWQHRDRANDLRPNIAYAGMTDDDKAEHRAKVRALRDAWKSENSKRSLSSG
jgi:hypothetical protein